ncbi:MAG: hypothetical protein Q8R92_04200 [Deltaproteobacteria bacterium]|nr:hypothetical protein [Deltaproteobacteria bacterium]
MIYTVQQCDSRGRYVPDGDAWLVRARSPQHAVDLVAADGWRAGHGEGCVVALVADLAKWTRGGDPPLPLVTPETIQYGIWRPHSEVTWAGYGGVPDGWHYCGGCGLVREMESEWATDGDECDECTGCESQGCDAPAAWIDSGVTSGSGWCAEQRDHGPCEPDEPDEPDEKDSDDD